MSGKVTTVRDAGPASIREVQITSNEDPSKIVSLLGGTIRLEYYESLLQDTIRATLVYVDSGESIDGKTVFEGLPIVGQERVKIKFEDNQKNVIGDDPELILYVNSVIPISDDTTKSMVMLDLVSKEWILNEKVRLNTRFNGKISDHVQEILTKKEYLGSEKYSEERWEETTEEYNFIGDNRKAFYTMNWLSAKAVPSSNESALESSAGYFLWETADGYHFRSIDWLMNKEENKVKKSIIYNQSPDGGGDNIPEGYDIKALESVKDNRINIQKKLKLGAYTTRTVVFDPFNCKYDVITPNAFGDKETKGSQKNLKKAAEKLPVMNPEFDMNKREGGESNKDGIDSKEFSRTQYVLLDTGSLPKPVASKPNKWSRSTKKQLERSTQLNFNAPAVLSQASMRYNQLYSMKTTITIPGDFSLHAGDAIFVDGPELTAKSESDEIDKKDGGLYIISDICHYLSDKETYTKMSLVRDSIGRKGRPTER